VTRPIHQPGPHRDRGPYTGGQGRGNDGSPVRARHLGSTGSTSGSYEIWWDHMSRTKQWTVTFAPTVAA